MSPGATTNNYINFATYFQISRCSTVYFPPDTLHYESIINTWLNTWKSDFKIDHQEHIASLFKWFIPACLKTVQNLEVSFDLHENVIVKNVLTYFQLLLDEAHANNSDSKKEEDLKNHPTWIHASLIQAGVLGFSSLMSCNSIMKFDEFYKQLWKGVHPKYPYPKFMDKLEVGIPTDGLLLDHFYLYKQRGTWKLWSDLLKNEKIVESDYLNSWIIPTVDNMRCNFFLDLHMKYNQKLVIVGAKNSGKSLTLQQCYLSNLEECCFITMSRHLSAEKFQNILLSKLNKVSTSCYRPQGKNCICFLDDLHLNSLDSNELLRQHLDHHVWYDLNNWTEISLEKVVFMAAATSSIYNNVCKRVLKHFNVFGLNTLTDEGMRRIYSQSLSHTWKKSGFPGDVLSAVDQMVDILLQVYQNLKVALKPSLIKPHYSFDLRSFAKVIQGCTYLKKETYDSNKKVYLKVFVHEMIRVFTDPLTSEDTSVGLETIKKLVEDNLPDDASEFFTNDWDRMFFSRYLAKNINCYEEMSWQILKDGCEHHLQDFNRTSSFKLDLIFFDYALEQVAKLCRLIHVPSEHCILFGTTGSGRQSLSKFSAYISQMDFVQPAFSSQNLTEDLKLILKQCGSLNQKTVFFLSEEHLQGGDKIFQVIDHYLRNGDITDLFNSGEQQDILELTRLAAQGGNKNLDITAHKVFLYFNKMCRQNLHLILSLDLQSPKLRRRIADYPTLVSRINPIFWPVWPDTALQCVAENFLSNIPLDNQIKIAEVAVKIYKTFPSTTPKKFWHFNTLFVNLITRKQQELKLQREKFQKGLDKLSYAANQILDMQKVLAEYQPLLEDMTKNAIKMTEQIALETSEVEKASALVRTDEKIAHNQAAVAQVLKSECESELAQAIPILEDAISALNTLKPSDITLVKSMKNPPDAIKLVMASVCVIKEVKPDKIPDASTGRKTLDFWGPSKRILGDMNFLQSLKDFDKDHIKPEIIAKIRKEYLPHKDFKPSVVAKASSAAEGLCKWIIAMDMYDKVAKEVAPKKVKLDKAEREYAETMKVLNEKKEEVIRIEEKLAQLKALLEEATKKQEKLQHEVDLCNIKLESAQNLIGGLSGDKQRWTDASDNLQKCYENLAGDMLLCSALVAYAAEIHQEARNVNISKSRKYINEFEIPATNQKEFKFTSTLTVPAEMESWLPNNHFFIENFLIYFNSRHFSIFNDPHGQVAQWLLNSENGNSLIVTKFTYNDWLPKFKHTISSGGRILIKDTTGHLPKSLKQFLYGYTRVEPDGTRYVTIDQEKLLVHKNSKVYIVSCKPNCCYSPEIHSKVTVINFSLTVQILEDDLLKTLVEIEKPEIRRKTLRLVEANRENNALIQQLELKILDTLCESQVDILEDVASISILDKSKELSKVALEKQNESRLIAEEIDDFKQDYLQVAKYVAKLFFSIEALQKLHSKYQYSLKWFKEVYFMSILNSGKSKVVETRCVNICQAFSFDLFKHISRGLFEKHKLLFTFWMALHSTNKPAEEFFAAENLKTKPFWITDEQWQDLLGGTCAIHTLSVTPYQQLLLTKTFKPENLTQQIGLFIKQVLGETFLKPRFFNMQDTYNDSNSLMPITFILTSNLNVLESLQSFAKIKQVLHKFHYLSLDGFNSNRAEDLIKHCQKEGSWVLLQNCQYTGKWLFQLERHLESLDFENTHENFRLFLTIEAEHEFPLEVIQSCLKIINEPSTKMKENLMETYTKPPVAVDDYYYSCPSQQIVFSRLLYRLCCFHFVLKTRKVIEPSESDLHWSLHFLKTFISDEGNLFHKVDYIIGHCIYNCYLESQEDKLLLSKLLQGYVNLSVITDKSVALKYVPAKKDRRDYLVYISNLPEETLPETLYLTQQQLLNQQLLETSEFLKNGITLSGCCTRTNQLNPKDLVEDLLNVLPSNFLGNPEAPGHIQRELQLYQTLLRTIKTTLVNLSTSLEDGEFFPEDLERLLQDLTKHQVPKMWLKLCYPTLANLGTFMSHLNENVQFINRYATQPKVPVLLRALYFPRVILSLAKLDFVSKNKTKIEDVGFVYKVSDGVKIEEGVVIEGLVLNGASYSQIDDRIVELPPKTWCTQMPLVGFEAVSQVKRSEPTCPVQIFKTTPSEINDGFQYGTSNFVTTVKLKCSKSEDFWIKRGVIILCENLLGLKM